MSLPMGEGSLPGSLIARSPGDLLNGDIERVIAVRSQRIAEAVGSAANHVQLELFDGNGHPTLFDSTKFPEV